MDMLESSSLQTVVLDAIISRAQAACERYRRAAALGNPPRQTARARYQRLRQMERALSRLQEQRLAATSSSEPGLS
jgi:hypothetical protein